MAGLPAISEKIQASYKDMRGEHDRYRSWEHCYRYFRETSPSGLSADRRHAALQLGFYLASWGMYRGSSFLLQYTYTVHLGVIDQLCAPEYAGLWEREVGASGRDLELVKTIMNAARAIREAYRPFAPKSEARQASDILVTKILLGTIGCLPACDRYFIRGFKEAGLKFSYLNSLFVERVLHFCLEHSSELREQQVLIEKAGGLRYPLMKLVDMYFWQIGYEMDLKRPPPIARGEARCAVISI